MNGVRLLLLLSITFAAPIAASACALRVHLYSSDSHQPLPRQLRVELLNGMDMKIAEGITLDSNDVEFDVRAGRYKIRISGMDVAEVTGSTFEIDSTENFHTEMLAVKVTNKDSGSQPTGGFVRASELNVPEKARREFDKGVESLQAKNFGDAEKHLKKAIEIFPNYTSAWDRLGVVYSDENDMPNAIAAFRRSVAVDSKNTDAQFDLSQAYITAKEPENAEPLLTALVQSQPKAVAAWAMLAQAQLSRGEYDAALASARTVHSMPHQKFAAAHLIAMHVLAMKHDPGAVDEARIYLQEDPNGRMAAFVRQRLAEYDQKHPRAEEHGNVN